MPSLHYHWTLQQDIQTVPTTLKVNLKAKIFCGIMGAMVTKKLLGPSEHSKYAHNISFAELESNESPSYWIALKLSTIFRRLTNGWSSVDQLEVSIKLCSRSVWFCDLCVTWSSSCSSCSTGRLWFVNHIINIIAHTFFKGIFKVINHIKGLLSRKKDYLTLL